MPKPDGQVLAKLASVLKQMNSCFGLVRWTAAVMAGLFLAGCGMSERKAAGRLDWTPQVVQQASDLIAADPELGRYQIIVDGFKGDMELKGQVATQAQKDRAEKLLWAVRGVRSVDNEIKVGSAK